MTDMTSGKTVRERIAALRHWMRENGISACIIPTADPHMSEYISDHYQSREYITGFTGSAGTAVITDGSAGLWTDSRYWLQAEQELTGSGINLMREGIDGTPSLEDWLIQQLSGNEYAYRDEHVYSDAANRAEKNVYGDASLHREDIIVDGTERADRIFGRNDAGRPEQTVCVYGELISASLAKKLRKALSPCGIVLETDMDPVAALWPDRPPLQPREVLDHPLQYAGVSREEKIDLIRHDMNRILREQGCTSAALILPALDDIAWLLNLRGSDIPCNPVFYAFAIVTFGETHLYAHTDQFSSDLRQNLAAAGVALLPYEQFYSDLASFASTSMYSVILDRRQCNQRILQSLPPAVNIIDVPSSVTRRKCIKNTVEMDGIRTAHLRDGVAMCRFLYWLKQRMQEPKSVPLTERSAAEKLLAFRSEQELFRGESFDPIFGYGPHGAIVHYSATEESDAVLEPHGLLLIDSGGQYLDGTTDITRTIALGPLTDEEKRCFTAVLRGHIALARAVFHKGCTGANLDVLAHQPLWEMGLDYGHGTGHGVGAYLNVHEDPLRIHWAAKDQPAFAEGMLTSDEPGYYAACKFGIRHENLLLCVSAEEFPCVPVDESPCVSAEINLRESAGESSCVSDDQSLDASTDESSCVSTNQSLNEPGGDFLCFEPVTLVPFDREGIQPELLREDEITWLNAYHERVWNKISPYLNDAERDWLYEATRPF